MKRKKSVEADEQRKTAAAAKAAVEKAEAAKRTKRSEETKEPTAEANNRTKSNGSRAAA